MQIKLNVEEKRELEFRHKDEKDGRIRDRIKSVLLRDEGWSMEYKQDWTSLTLAS